MTTQGFSEMSTRELETLLAERAEGEFELVDVRQPQEYQAGHIPGATLLPLGEVERNLGQLPPDRDVVFYCAAGRRSALAARLAAESGRFGGQLFSLAGGFGAWQGLALPDFPRLEAIAPGADADLRGMLLRAMEHEKATMLLYQNIAEAAQGAERTRIICSLMQELAGFEEAHARSVYERLAALPPEGAPLLPFAELFAGLGGEILEGGRSPGDLRPWIDAALQGGCMELAELALELETAALDLYAALARRVDEPGAREIFLSLAQQEKGHARLLLKHLDAFAAAATG